MTDRFDHYDLFRDLCTATAAGYFGEVPAPLAGVEYRLLLEFGDEGGPTREYTAYDSPIAYVCVYEQPRDDGDVRRFPMHLTVELSSIDAMAEMTPRRARELARMLEEAASHYEALRCAGVGTDCHGRAA